MTSWHDTSKLSDLAVLPCRLPYAVMKSSRQLRNLQTKLWDQRATRLAASPGGQLAAAGLQGILDHMIVPASLDSYLSPDPKLTGAEIVDFRHKYRPKQSRNRNKETVGYDARPHGHHPRRLLLSAECQIGKTGVYLALLKDLKTILKPDTAVPDIDVALPDFDSLQPASTADESDVPNQDEVGSVVVDYHT